jgi:cell division inhibitor SepF
MAKIVDKMLGLLGFEFEEEESFESREEISPWNEPKERVRRNNVVSLPSAKSMKMVIVKPSNFDQVQGIADHLKNRRPVIVNLDGLDKDLARRIVDFLSGTTYALGGSMQKVSGTIMLFVPHNVDVAGDLDTGYMERLALSKTKSL